MFQFRKRLYFVVMIFTLSFSGSMAFANLWAECDSYDPCTVPTFECIGIYWTPISGAGGECSVRFREATGILPPGLWRDGMNLWYDDRVGDNASEYVGPSWRQEEYRGSIVDLKPNTRYEIELSIEGGSTETIYETTWSEVYPEAIATIYLGMPTSVPGGTEDAYQVYTGNITANNLSDEYCVKVDEPYVILRNMQLSGGQQGIIIGENAHHVVIEDCDISGWGSPSPTSGWGNGDGGIFIDNGWADSDPPEDALASRSIHHVVIQRNRIHHPKFDSNSWCEYNVDNIWDPWHPLGPLGIRIHNPEGNLVIRYNEIYSETGKYFVDGIGGASNYSFFGCPGRDSDVYGNRISHLWDDAIETEGGNSNVRVWGNYLDKCRVGVACAATSSGPLYIWRNVLDRTDQYDIKALEEIESNITHPDSTRNCWKYNWGSPTLNSGRFIKATTKFNDGYYWGSGRVYVFHNTLLQRENDTTDDYWHEEYGWPMWSTPIDQGAMFGVTTSKLSNFVLRNNLFHVSHYYCYSLGVPDESVNTHLNTLPVDTDYNMLNGNLSVYSYSIEEGTITVEIQETNDVWDPNGFYSFNDADYKPEWDNLYIPDTGESGNFWIAPGTPGYDDGQPIANFNDGAQTHGTGPDMGAHEYGTSPMAFGVIGAISAVSSQTNSTTEMMKLFCSPNPSGARITVEYPISQVQFNSTNRPQVELSIFDVRGRCVKTIFHEPTSDGLQSLIWDGTADDGNRVSAGIYFMKLKIGKQFRSAKVVVLR